MMHKTYYGKSLQDAMSQAKTDYGSDILILDTKIVPSTEKNSHHLNDVEITVAVDEYNNANKINSSNEPDSSQDFKALLNSVIKKKGIPEKTKSIRSDLEITSLRGEISQLSHQLHQLVHPEYPEPFGSIYAKLARTGMSNTVASLFTRSLFLSSVNDKPVDELTLLDQLKPVFLSYFKSLESSNMVVSKGRKIIPVIGPTGVGKTSLIMKLALNKNYFGNQKVSILSMDSYRISAHEPLRTFSNLTTIPVEHVKDPLELANRIKLNNKAEVLLIDTPGRSPLFNDYVKEMKQYFDIINPTDVILALSATADLEDLYLGSVLFLMLGATQTILTKADETARVGKVLSIMEELKIPLVGVSFGQSVPEDISLNSGEQIWQKLRASF